MVSTRTPAGHLKTALMAGVTLVAGGVLFAAAVYGQGVTRTTDGHPDLSGLYVGGANLPSGGDTQNYASRGGNFFGFEEDNGLVRQSDRNRPVYKPEYWEQIKSNDYNGNWIDPVHKCLPAGVPGLGMPAQVVNVAGQPAVILLYRGGFTGYGQRYVNWPEVRWVWTDGRPHDPAQLVQESYNGDAIGHWEGDTLVIETIGFTDNTWLTRTGFIHGFQMKVTERMSRDGDTLKWEATVEDPEYFQEPWVLLPASAKINPKPGAVLGATPPCQDFDAGLLSSPTQSQ